MRIRSIRPEFWRSEDVKKHPRDVRLLFVGLWSYVDDNGVGVDDYRQIAADLFPLEDDPVEVREFVREGLATLSRGLQIVRFEVDGKRYLFIPKWDTHQKIDRPGKERYLRPDNPVISGNPTFTTGHTDDSRDPRDSLDAGEGEKGRRGEGEEKLSPRGDAVVLEMPLHVPVGPKYPDAFEAAWTAYGRKGAKKTAHAEWQRVAKRADLAQVAAAIPAYVRSTPDMKFRKDFERWLKGDCWESAVVSRASGYTAYQDPEDLSGYYEDL